MTSKTRKTDHRSQSAVKYVKELIQTNRKRERERERVQTKTEEKRMF